MIFRAGVNQSPKSRSRSLHQPRDRVPVQVRRVAAAVFAGLAVFGLLIMTLVEDRVLREVRSGPAAGDKRLVRVFVLLVVLALIAFYVWFKINAVSDGLQ